MRFLQSRRSVRLFLAAVAGIAFSIGGAGAAFAAGPQSGDPSGAPAVTAPGRTDQPPGLEDEFPWF